MVSAVALNGLSIAIFIDLYKLLASIRGLTSKMVARSVVSVILLSLGEQCSFRQEIMDGSCIYKR
jgi:uncharacterized membrane protein YczE